MSDTEIGEVGMRHTHDAAATAIPALSVPRLSVCCSYCIKIIQSTLWFTVRLGFTKWACFILFLKCFKLHKDHITLRKERMGQEMRE